MIGYQRNTNVVAFGANLDLGMNEQCKKHKGVMLIYMPSKEGYLKSTK
jgi:hypothetical protein